MPRGRPKKVPDVSIQPPGSQEAQEQAVAPVAEIAVAKPQDIDVITEQDVDVLVPSHVKAEFDRDSNCVTFTGRVFSESVSLTAPKEIIRRIISRVAG